MQKFFLILLISITCTLAKAEQSTYDFQNNLGINILAIPVANGVVTYERFFNKQSVWIGLEHHFNEPEDGSDRNTNSVALEYRRYFTGKSSRADGLFAGVYAKTRWGKEINQENRSEFHRYTVLFSGLNAGYQYHIKRLVFSAFVGYGIPLALAEESFPAGNPEDLNQGYKMDLRIGLTVGFAF